MLSLIFFALLFVLGFSGKSLKLLTEMAEKFPSSIELKNQIAVGYLLIGQNKLAKEVLLQVRIDIKNAYSIHPCIKSNHKIFLNFPLFMLVINF